MDMLSPAGWVLLMCVCCHLPSPKHSSSLPGGSVSCLLVQPGLKAPCEPQSVLMVRVWKVTGWDGLQTRMKEGERMYSDKFTIPGVPGTWWVLCCPGPCLPS